MFHRPLFNAGASQPYALPEDRGASKERTLFLDKSLSIPDTAQGAACLVTNDLVVAPFA